MSWSFSAIGKPAAVAAKCRDTIENGYKCAEPEETIRKTVLEAAAMAAEAHDATQYAVSVEASGSMLRDNGVCKSNNVRLEVRPIYGFLND